MTKITCDLCESEITGTPIRVEMRDGEHPHNGSRMTKTVDCCEDCASKIPNLETSAEYDDIKAKLGST
jgi:hypothetical protein